MKTRVIVDPANQDRPSPLGDIPQGEIVAMMQLPATPDFAHCLGSFVADCRRETDKQFSSAIHRLPGSKRKAQKIEAVLRITVRPVRALAVDDLRLLRVQFSLARRHPRFQRSPQGTPLRFIATV